MGIAVLDFIHAFVQEDGVAEIAAAAFGAGELTSPPDEESADPTGIDRVTAFMDKAFGSGNDYNPIDSYPNPTKW